MLTKFCYIFAIFAIVHFHVHAEKKSSPNIILILADDINRDSLGTYGSKDCKTPNIDQLAKEGMKFNKMYSTVAMCAPFRQELYSGRSPWRTGTLANHSKSKADTKSIPHYLNKLGYRTALVGKTHFGPQQAYPFQYLGKGKSKSKTSDKNLFYKETTNTFIDSCLKENKNFFLVIASQDGHHPFTTGDPKKYNKDELSIPPYWSDTIELRETLVNYYAEVSNFDKLVGMIRQVCVSKKILDNTIFIVCSEQGIQLPFAKWTCYDNGLRTGFIVRWPGMVKAGSTYNELVSTSDVAPTIVKAAGGTYTKNDFDGKSFLRALKGEATKQHKYLYGAFTNCNIIQNRDRIYPIRLIRNNQFNLIYNPNFKKQTANLTLMAAKYELENSKPKVKPKGGEIGLSWVEKSKTDSKTKELVHKFFNRPEYELYDIEKDPHELNNLASNPEYSKVLEQLKTELHRKLKNLGDSDPIVTERKLVKRKK